ncbi:D-alanine--D-serine ligase VanG [uncultured Acetatifactor sp.]|uniref:D-alanine--D-serine ligase VanG n=1 Tax=uncultured Acetatifactor sp. TaxID=1671927 RepID=UPI00261D0C85|nr:D-alanine--D-serine ligase VanG [uncultured Acetatifactor sp.]
MKKINVGIFFGGCSPEYSVSLSSASGVILNLDREKYEPVLIGISQKGEWFHYAGPVDRLLDDSWQNPADCTPAVLSPNRGENCLLLLGKEGVSRVPLDIAFPVLHGGNGEDGTLQGLLELSGIPIAGCGTLASALGMDKDRAHRLVSLEGVRVPMHLVMDPDTAAEEMERFAEKIGYPVYVKPVKAGSSYGVTKVSGREQLAPAVDLAFRYDSQVLLEENIPGFEVGCAVLGNKDLITGEVDEIELSGGFFDFEEKYTLKTSAIHCPARIAPEKAAEVQEAAKRGYRALDCRVFARVDFFLTPEGRVVFNEANTIPGFTAHSRYPAMMKGIGLDFPALLDRLVELGAGA